MLYWMNMASILLMLFVVLSLLLTEFIHQEFQLKLFWVVLFLVAEIRICMELFKGRNRRFNGWWFWGFVFTCMAWVLVSFL